MWSPCYLMVIGSSGLNNRDIVFEWRSRPDERLADSTNSAVFLLPFSDSLSSGDDEDYDEDPEDAGNGNGEFSITTIWLTSVDNAAVWCRDEQPCVEPATSQSLNLSVFLQKLSLKSQNSTLLKTEQSVLQLSVVSPFKHEAFTCFSSQKYNLTSIKAPWTASLSLMCSTCLPRCCECVYSDED